MPKINRTHNTQLQWHFSYHSDWNIGPTNRSTFIELAKRWAQHKNVVRKIGFSEFFRKWMCVWALVVTRARLSLIPYKIESEKPNNQSTKWTGKHCNFCLLSQYKPWPISVFLFFYTFHTFQESTSTEKNERKKIAMFISFWQTFCDCLQTFPGCRMIMVFLALESAFFALTVYKSDREDLGKMANLNWVRCSLIGRAHLKNHTTTVYHVMIMRRYANLPFIPTFAAIFPQAYGVPRICEIYFFIVFPIIIMFMKWNGQIFSLSFSCSRFLWPFTLRYCDVN